MALLGLVVAGVDLGTELHLLDLDLGLVLTSLLGLDRLLVLELAVVHDLADGRLRVGRDLDEVEALLGGDAVGVAHAEQAQLRAVDADQATRASGDFPIDAGTFGLGYLTHLPFPAAHRSVPRRIQETGAALGTAPARFRRERPDGGKVPLSDQTAARGRRSGGAA